MKKHTMFVINFLKKYESVCPEIVKDWCCNDIQEKFNSFKSKKCCVHECTHENITKLQKTTCYILFCIDRRKELQDLNPYTPNKTITSMLASEWREHKKINDEIYNKYKTQYQKTMFFEKHRNVVQETYPELNPEEIEITLEQLYTKYMNQK